MRGLGFLRRLQLAEPDHTLLQEALSLHDLTAEQIRAQAKRITRDFRREPIYERLLSLPGVGHILAAVLAVEIDQVQRFQSAEKLCAYAGVAPTTHSSGGKVYHGRLLPSCNKWLRWALIEVRWVAIGCSAYFGTMYRLQRAKGKKANTAITIVARRMCRILFALLKEKRNFENRAQKAQYSSVPGCSVHRLTAISFGGS